MNNTNLQAYEKTMFAFDIDVTSNGVAQELVGSVDMIVKVNKSDTDEQAVLNEQAIDYSNNKARFAFDVDITPGVYFYDILWTNGTAQYVIAYGKIEVRSRVHD